MPTYIDATLAQGAITESRVSAPIELGNNTGTRRLTLNVIAASGSSPTLTTIVETSMQGDPTYPTGWVEIARFTVATDVGSQSQLFSGVQRFVRLREVVTGAGASFTRSVVAIPLAS